MYNDISLTNIIIDDNMNLYLIDYESTYTMCDSHTDTDKDFCQFGTLGFYEKAFKGQYDSIEEMQLDLEQLFRR